MIFENSALTMILTTFSYEIFNWKFPYITFKKFFYCIHFLFFVDFTSLFFHKNRCQKQVLGFLCKYCTKKQNTIEFILFCY